MSWPVLTPEGAQRLIDRLVQDDAPIAEKVQAILRISVAPDELTSLCTVLGVAFVADPPAFVATDQIVGLDPADWEHLQQRWNGIAEGRYCYVDEDGNRAAAS